VLRFLIATVVLFAAAHAQTQLGASRWIRAIARSWQPRSCPIA